MCWVLVVRRPWESGGGGLYWGLGWVMFGVWGYVGRNVGLLWGVWVHGEERWKELSERIMNIVKRCDICVCSFSLIGIHVVCELSGGKYLVSVQIDVEST